MFRARALRKNSFSSSSEIFLPRQPCGVQQLHESHRLLKLTTADNFCAPDSISHTAEAG